MQRDVDHLLNRGVFDSIVWIAGLGSGYSLYCAARARRLISASGGELRGTARVWWCFVVGGIGVSLLSTLLVAMVRGALQT